MRLFVAVNLPEVERAAVHRAVESLRASDLPVRWVAADNLHLTLVFLGEVEAGRVDSVADAIRRVASGHPPLTLELGRLGAFPNLRRPRVLWVGVEGGPPLSELQWDVESELAPLGFTPEDRAFHPHVTVGRALKHRRPRDFAGLATLAETVTYRRHVEIGTVDLMRSRSSPSGVRYHVLASCPLAGAG